VDAGIDVRRTKFAPLQHGLRALRLLARCEDRRSIFDVRLVNDECEFDRVPSGRCRDDIVIARSLIGHETRYASGQQP
jgi:hypothetical protein